MQIIFAGQPIGTEGDFGGTDGIEGFMPSKKPNTEWVEALEGQDAYPVSWFNRKRQLTGTITTQPFDNIDQALMAALTWLDNLPDQGELIIRSGNWQATFNQAVLSMPPIKRKGILLIAQLTFDVGPAVVAQVNQPIQTDSGTDIETDSGQQISS